MGGHRCCRDSTSSLVQGGPLPLPRPAAPPPPPAPLTLWVLRRVLSGVHPREGILYLTPFAALQRVAMCGNARCAAAAASHPHHAAGGLASLTRGEPPLLLHADLAPPPCPFPPQLLRAARCVACPF